MKIAFLNKYQNKVNRGAETFVLELSKRFLKKHKVDVISDINYFKILKEKYDVIIPTNGREQAFITRLLTWLTGSKMIISGQSGIGFDDRLNLLSFPDCFVVLTDLALQESKKRNPFVKIVKIPNGVDLDKFNYKNKSNNTSKIKTILSVGAFTKDKRHDLTIKAVSSIKNAKLVIAGGGGELKSEIKKLGDNLLGKDRFEVLTLNHNDMPSIYKRADIFTFPTVPWESFGIVLLEAMASGLPVVATDDPIRQEIVGHAGLLVDPIYTDEYAKAIEKALNTNWGDKPRKQAEKFSWDNIAEEYEKLFKSL